MSTKHSRITLILITISILTITATANAETTITGSMQGLNCCLNNRILLTDDRVDAVIALESDFVLYVKKGEFWLLPNLAHAVKSRHVGQVIRVTGEKLNGYNAIDVEKLEVRQDDIFKTVWTKKWQQEEDARRQREEEAP